MVPHPRTRLQSVSAQAPPAPGRVCQWRCGTLAIKRLPHGPSLATAPGWSWSREKLSLQSVVAGERDRPDVAPASAMDQVSGPSRGRWSTPSVNPPSGRVRRAQPPGGYAPGVVAGEEVRRRAMARAGGRWQCDDLWEKVWKLNLLRHLLPALRHDGIDVRVRATQSVFSVVFS